MFGLSDGQASGHTRLTIVHEILEALDIGGAEVTANSADYTRRPDHAAVSADELFQGSAPVRSAEDLAQEGVFDDDELEEFLADLTAMRRADLA